MLPVVPFMSWLIRDAFSHLLAPGDVLWLAGKLNHEAIDVCNLYWETSKTTADQVDSNCPAPHKVDTFKEIK